MNTLEDLIKKDYKKLQEKVLYNQQNNINENFLEKTNPLYDIAIRLEKQILLDIKHYNFTMVYQPQIRANFLATRAESLFRYEINGIAINPSVVFYLIKNAKMEQYVLFKQLDIVCRDVKRFIKELNENDFRATINIAPELFDRAFCNAFLSHIEFYGLSPSHIGIELVESSPFTTVDASLMKEMQNEGIKFYLDDFGTSYATFNVLSSLPFNYIKFSGFHIKGIDTNVLNQKFVKNTVNYCKIRKIKTIAENVETINELQVVKSLGIDGIQGYYYSKPLEPTQFIKKCKELNKDIEIQASIDIVNRKFDSNCESAVNDDYYDIFTNNK